MHCDQGIDFVDWILQEPRHTQIQAKIPKLFHYGHLGDWGYGIPTDNLHLSESLGSTPEIRIAGETKVLTWKDLHDMHSIVIPVADQPIPADASVCIDASLLQCTVYLL